MDTAYYFIEAFIVMAFAIVTVSISGRLHEAGIRHTGWMMSGFLIVFVIDIISALLSYEVVATMFVPRALEITAIASIALRIAGWLVVLSSVYFSFRDLMKNRVRDLEKRDRLEFLDSIHDSANQAVTLIELLNFSVRQLVEEASADWGAVFIFNPNQKKLILAVHQDLPRELEKSMELLDNPASLFYRAQSSGRPQSIGNIADADRTTSQMLSGSVCKSLIAVPLISRSGVTGVIALFSGHEYFFNRRRMQLAVSAANIIGPAVASFRMERDLRDNLGKYEEYKKSGDFAHKALVSLKNANDLGKSMQSLLRLFATRFKVEAARIYKIESRGIHPNITIGTPPDLPHELTDHYYKSIRNKKSLIIRSDVPAGSFKTMILPSPSNSANVYVTVIYCGVDYPEFDSADIETIKSYLRIFDLLVKYNDYRVQLSRLGSVPAEFEGIRTHDKLLEVLQKCMTWFGINLNNGLLAKVNLEAGSYSFKAVLDSKHCPLTGRTYDFDSRRMVRLFMSDDLMLLEDTNLFDSLVADSKSTELKSLIAEFRQADNQRLYLLPLNISSTRYNLFLTVTESPLGKVGLKSVWPVFDLALRLALGSMEHYELKKLPGIKLKSEEMEELNYVNNILTGILGNAQLLAFGMKNEDLENKHQVLLNLDKIADEAFRAGRLIQKLQERTEIVGESAPPRSSIDSVLKSMTLNQSDNHRRRISLRDYPDLYFDCLPESEAITPLDETRVRALFGSLFNYVRKKWQPDEEVSIRLLDSDNGIFFIISETVLGDVAVDIQSYTYLPIREFPDREVARDLDVSYCFDDLDGRGRVLVLRFPRLPAIQKKRTGEPDKLSVLAIDDQEMIRDLLSSMLGELGYVYDIFPDGTSGLQAYERHHYDLLITDLGLPDLDGWEVARRIRRKNPDIPVIVISGWGIEEAQRKAPDDLADYILSKPFRMEQLGEMIKAAAKKHSSSF